MSRWLQAALAVDDGGYANDKTAKGDKTSDEGGFVTNCAIVTGIDGPKRRLRLVVLQSDEDDVEREAIQFFDGGEAGDADG